MDHLMSRPLLAILDSFFKFGANVGLNMLINISPGFYHVRKKKFVANIFCIFQQQKALVGIKRPFQDIWHKIFESESESDINSSVSQITV